MTEREIYDGVVVNGTADFAFVAGALRQRGIAWCMVGNFAVNAHATTVYTADLDMVVAPADLIAVMEDLRAADFLEKPFPDSTKIQRRSGPLVQGTYRLTIRFITSGSFPAVRCESNHEISSRARSPRRRAEGCRARQALGLGRSDSPSI